MRSSIYKTNITGLYQICILALPLLIALFFGHNNPYKVLFLLIIGYVILTILILLNMDRIFDIVFYRTNMNYKKDGILYSRDFFTILMGEPVREDFTAEDVEKYRFDYGNGRAIELNKEDSVELAKNGGYVTGMGHVSPFPTEKASIEKKKLVEDEEEKDEV